MTYDQRCEIFRFAMRKIRFVFAGFGLHRGPKHNRLDHSPPPPDRRRFEELDREKSRKGGLKALESLARVNLCEPDAPAPLKAPRVRSEGPTKAEHGPVLRPIASFYVGESGRTTVESWRFV
jgi:hypothetical protein